jgi:hypothetical protein
MQINQTVKSLEKDITDLEHQITTVQIYEPEDKDYLQFLRNKMTNLFVKLTELESREVWIRN